MNRKNKADILLGTLFLAFAIINIAKWFMPDNFYIGMLVFVIEAALIGGIADWFAVTALFKKPLGFPWHTAIIPNNRKNIIESVSNMVKNELINEEMIKSWLARINFIELLDNQLTNKFSYMNPEMLIANFIESRILKTDAQKKARYISLKVKRKIKRISASRLLAKSAEYFLQYERCKKFISHAAPRIAKLLNHQKARDVILRMLKNIEAESDSIMFSFFIRRTLNLKHKDDGANKLIVPELLQQALVSSTKYLVDHDNAFYERIRNSITELVNVLNADQEYNEAVESYKNSIIDHIELEGVAEKIIKSAIDSDLRRSFLVEWVPKQAGAYWEQFKNDKTAQEWINSIIREALIKVLSKEHHIITDIIAETMESFSDEKLIAFVQEKVGDDLQWIRINGSIVGGVFGLIIFLFLKLIMDPFVVPAVHKLIQGAI